MRESCKSKAEALARETDTNAIDLKFIEQVIADARKGMAAPLEKTQSHPWDAQAVEMLQTVPEGYCREMTQDAVNAIAQAKGISAITPEFVTVVMETISASSENITSQLNWSAAAKTRIQAVPESVRGMLIKEIESWVLRQGIDEVDTVHMDAVKEQWQAKGFFHLDPADDRHQS